MLLYSCYLRDLPPEDTAVICQCPVWYVEQAYVQFELEAYKDQHGYEMLWH